MVTLRKFLCLDLVTAGIVIGWVCLAGSLKLSVISYLLIGNLYAILPGNVNIELRGNAILMCIFFLGFLIADIIASILLILSAYRRNHYFALPWLISTALGIIVSVLFIIGALTAANSVVQIAILVVALILIIVFFSYAWFAIYSLYIFLQNLALNKPPQVSV